MKLDWDLLAANWFLFGVFLIGSGHVGKAIEKLLLVKTRMRY